MLIQTGQTPSHGGERPPFFASSSPSSAPRQKQELLTGILAPLSSSHSSPGRLPGSPTPTPVRRKPLPSTASPSAARLSSPRLETTREESKAEAKPLVHQRSHTLGYAGQSSPTPTELPDFVVRDLDRFPHGQTPLVPQTHDFSSLISIVNEQESPPQSIHGPSRNSPSKPNYATFPSPNKNYNLLDNSGGDSWSTGTARHNGAAAMSLHSFSKPRNFSLSLDVNSRNSHSQHGDPYDINNIPKPKSPGGKFTSFFGWKTSQSPGAASSSTAFSDKSSPESPLYIKPQSRGKLAPTNGAAHLVIDIPRANDSTDSAFFDGSRLSMLPITPGTSKLVRDMEDELRQITSELASSIRREMDLEDLVDRLQSDANQPQEASKRTSDYFSDSGTSSVRYPQWDGDSKQEEWERLQRRAEQEKAQLRLELTQKIQEERSGRMRLETHIRKLEEQPPKVDHPQVTSADASERIRELEASLEDARRRLLEERQANSNFEDLIGALRGEIEDRQYERDNLRDEVVPELQARVEDLKSEVADIQKLTSENAKMQQELQSLQNENNTLVNARKLQLEMQQQQMRFNSIAEEVQGQNSQAKVGMTRSNTTVRNSTMGASRSSSLSRSNSLKEREPREIPADRVKDIEAQRDALHCALKSLLERQEYQERDYTKKIRALETELDRSLNGTPRGSPRSRGFDRTNWRLREISDLRRRAKAGIL